jgi:hypothetical protein
MISMFTIFLYFVSNLDAGTCKFTITVHNFIIMVLAHLVAVVDNLDMVKICRTMDATSS